MTTIATLAPAAPATREERVRLLLAAAFASAALLAGGCWNESSQSVAERAVERSYEGSFSCASLGEHDGSELWECVAIDTGLRCLVPMESDGSVYHYKIECE